MGALIRFGARQLVSGRVYSSVRVSIAAIGILEEGAPGMLGCVRMHSMWASACMVVWVR